jgi:hypothetical protein
MFKFKPPMNARTRLPDFYRCFQHTKLAKIYPMDQQYMY